MAVINVTTEPAVDSQVPTITHYQQVAAEFLKALDQITATVPQIEEAETGPKINRGHLGVSDAFCVASVNAIEQLPQVQASKKIDPVAVRNKLQYLEAFRPIADTIAAVAKRVDYTLMFLKSAVVEDAYQIYRITKGFAGDKRSPLVQAHAATMKAALNRRGGTKQQREERKAEKLKLAVAEELAKGGWEVKKAA
jgi:hypothetical protein